MIKKYYGLTGPCVLSLLLLTGQHSMAATFYVNSNTDVSDNTPGDGVCETANGNGVCTLRAAIDEANTLAGADVINLPAATYTIQTTASYSNASGSFFITDAVDITGQDSATTIIDGNNLDRVMAVVATGVVNISNVTLQHGDASNTGVGGGLLAGGSSLQLTVSNSVIRNNQANDGAGLGSASPVQSLHLDGCLIENNTGTVPVGDYTSAGAGIYFSTGSLTITDTTIRNNTSYSGGGLSTIGDVVLIDSTVSENTSLMPPTVNNGYGGGGLHIGSGSSGSLLAINSTISGNRANTSGAGLLMVNGSAKLYNTTITGNIADADGDGEGYGGGFIGSHFLPQPSIYLSNSIVAGNDGGQQGPDCSDFNINIISYGYNLIGDATDCYFSSGPHDLIGTAETPLEPLLSALADNGGSTQTHALLPDSPAIDAGDPSGCDDDTGTPLANDQRKLTRHFDGGIGSARCDIGAVEINFILHARAGTDQAVTINEPVALDGSNSQSSRGIVSYAWIQTAGSNISLIDANTATPHFIAPAAATTISLNLTITDNNGDMSNDIIDITVSDNSTNGTAPSDNGGSGGALNGIILLALMLIISVTRSGVRIRNLRGSSTI